jgi:DNA-binding NarL/FixJ family response regulator
MRPLAVVVAHREAMVAEGLAAALGSYPQIVPIGAVTSAAAAEAYAGRADAAALDAGLDDVEGAASRLRRAGVRVVVLSEPGPEDEELRVPLSAPVATLAAALVPALARRRSRPEPLTSRQREILALVGRGLAGKQVARQLGISAKTVEQHKTRIFQKLGVPNQAAAVRVALGHGMERSSA